MFDALPCFLSAGPSSTGQDTMAYINSTVWKSTIPTFLPCRRDYINGWTHTAPVLHRVLLRATGLYFRPETERAIRMHYCLWFLPCFRHPAILVSFRLVPQQIPRYSRQSSPNKCWKIFFLDSSRSSRDLGPHLRSAPIASVTAKFKIQHG